MDMSSHYGWYQLYKKWADDALEEAKQYSPSSSTALLLATKAAAYASLAAAEAALCPDHRKN